jgi:adenylate kinase
LAREKGWPLIDLNFLVKRGGLCLRCEGREFVADVGRLRSKVLSLTRGKKDFVVEGHLACEFGFPCDAVAVLRCNPFILEKRLRERGYAAKKVDDNLLCEFLDYCGARAALNFKHCRVVEVDASKPLSPKKFLALVARPRKEPDWMPLLSGKRFARLLR